MGISAYFWKMVAPGFAEWDLVQELLDGFSNEAEYTHSHVEAKE